MDNNKKLSKTFIISLVVCGILVVWGLVLPKSFEAAANALKAAGISGKLPDSAKLKADYQRLAAEKDRLYSEYGKLKKQLREYDAVKQNVDSILSPAQQREQEKTL